MQRKRTHKNRRGTALVQAAMVLPIFLFFLFGIMEFGRYVMTLQLITNAAREGCRYALAHTEAVTISSTSYGNATSDVTNIITKVMAGRTLTGQTIQIYASSSTGTNLGTWTNASAGQSICVKISGNYSTMLPTFLNLPNTIPMTATAVMLSESS